MKVGVIGLGAMGAPVAHALASAHDVAVFDDDGRRLPDAPRTARVEASVDAVVARSDVVITVLPGADETAAVIRDAAAFAPGTIWLDLSTGDPRVTSALSRRLAAVGAGAVAAPMGGGPAGAWNRGLHFTVAGGAPSVRRVRPLLDGLAAPDGIEVIGDDPAHAQTVKLLSNVLWFAHVVAVTEAMLLGSAMGMEAGALRRWLASRAGGSVLLDRDYEAVLRGEYMPSFGIDRVVAQIATVRTLAEEHATPADLIGLVERTHRAALDAFGPIGGELLAARLLEQRAGISLAATVG